MSEQIDRNWFKKTDGSKKYGIPALYQKKPNTKCPNCGKYKFKEFKKQKKETVFLLEIFGYKLAKTEKLVEGEFEDLHAECSNCDYYTEEIEDE